MLAGMREWIPVPGSAKARLIESALHHFERSGFEAANVGELAAKAGVTTGSLYHHFGSKLGLYLTVRDDVERRIADRMEGAAENAGGVGRPAVRAALTVAFDAAVRFGACRVLGEPAAVDRPDVIETTLQGLLSERAEPTARILAAAWRTALLSVADGTSAASARAALQFVLDT
jgi:AcrR family transcriptional regulator